jgi:hypothetical protein
MAETRGGMRPNAPQNNFGISATGGSGSAQGQPVSTVGGFPNYGDGKDFQDIQSSAKMNKSGVNIPTGGAQSAIPSPLSDIVPLDAPTQYPDEPVSAGVDSGPGAGSSARTAPMMLAAQNDEDAAKLAALLPIYARIAESPQATNATRNYYRYLRSIVNNGVV